MKHYQEEVFGPTSLVIKCVDSAEVKRDSEHLEGQLTATLRMDDADLDVARQLLALEHKAGSILVHGWPTLIEVCRAIVYGRPYPTTDIAHQQWTPR